MNIEARTQRKSGIELLRIIAALMVVFSHLTPHFTQSFVTHGSVMGGGNYLIVNILREISVSAVDIFILISGFFLWNNNKRTLGKIINLVVLMAIINVSSYLLQIIIGKNSFEFDVFFRYLCTPNYFVTLYVVLFIISPYINILLQKMTYKGWLYFVIIIFLVFSVFNTAADIINEMTTINIKGISPIGREGSQHGYNIVNFCVLYCLGAFLSAQREKVLKIKTWIAVLIVAVSVAVLYVWSLIGINIQNYSNSAHNYHNPFIIVMAMCLFVCFDRMEFKSGFINHMAKAAFTTFLLHQHFFQFLPIDYIVQQSPFFFVLILMGMFVSIYLVSWVVWWLYNILSGKFFKWLDKIEIHYKI